MIISFSQVGKSVTCEVPCKTLPLNFSAQAMSAILKEHLVNADLQTCI